MKKKKTSSKPGKPPAKGRIILLLAAAAAASLEPEAQERGRVHQHLAYRGDEGCGCGGSAVRHRPHSR